MNMLTREHRDRTAPHLVRIASRALDVLGKLWNLPNTMLGLFAGAVGCVVGFAIGCRPGVSIANNAIQFTNLPFRSTGAGAVALGNVQLYHRALPSDFFLRYDGTWIVNLGRHEQAHTYQSQLLGPFFLPVYFAVGGISVRNPLENAADDYAAGTGSWWPWV